MAAVRLCATMSMSRPAVLTTHPDSSAGLGRLTRCSIDT